MEYENQFIMSHKCLSASTFTVLDNIIVTDKNSTVTNAYRQVHLLYRELERSQPVVGKSVTNAYRQVHLLYGFSSSGATGTSSVTNAYRQVHLLYPRLFI